MSDSAEEGLGDNQLLLRLTERNLCCVKRWAHSRALEVGASELTGGVDEAGHLSASLYKRTKRIRIAAMAGRPLVNHIWLQGCQLEYYIDTTLVYITGYSQASRLRLCPPS